MNNKGKITQIIGAVVDVNFEKDLPEIYTALEVINSGNKLILNTSLINFRKFSIYIEKVIPRIIPNNKKIYPDKLVISYPVLPSKFTMITPDIIKARPIIV